MKIVHWVSPLVVFYNQDFQWVVCTTRFVSPLLQNKVGGRAEHSAHPQPPLFLTWRYLAVDDYLADCWRASPYAGSRGIKEEALLSLLHSCDFDFGRARHAHSLLVQGTIDSSAVAGPGCMNGGIPCWAHHPPRSTHALLGLCLARIPRPVFYRGARMAIISSSRARIFHAG